MNLIYPCGRSGHSESVRCLTKDHHFSSFCGQLPCFVDLFCGLVLWTCFVDLFCGLVLPPGGLVFFLEWVATVFDMPVVGWCRSIERGGGHGRISANLSKKCPMIT